MGRYKHKPVKPKYKKEGEGFWRNKNPREIIVGKSRAAKGGGTEPLPSEQSKVDRRGRKAAAASKGTKSTIGRGKHGVRYEYLIPEHMKAPKKKAAAEKKVKKGGEGMGYIKEAAKRTKGTKAAPHMVRHTKAPDPSLRRLPSKDKKVTPPTKPRAATSFTEKAGVAQDIGPWKPTDRKATKPKVSYKKPKKTPFGMKKGGSVDTQWGGYNFKDGGRIPGIRPTRKGT